MDSILKMLWRDDEGFVITIELILIATIVGIGSIVGLTSLRDAINSELGDISEAIEEFEWSSKNKDAAGNTTADNSKEADSCIMFNVPPSDEL